MPRPRSRTMANSSIRREDASMAYDLLIKNGSIGDGTGAPARRGDVAISNGRLVAVG